MPSLNDQLRGSVDPILNKFVQGYSFKQFIYNRVVPVIPSLTESGTILTMGKDGFKIYNTTRAIGDKIPRAIREAYGTATFQMKEESIRREIDESEMEIAENYGVSQVLKLKQRRLAMCSMNIEMAKEKAVADVISSTTYYATGNKTTLTGGDQFSDYNNSDPIGVIDQTAKAAARADMGVEPNILVMGYTTWQKLKWHPQLREKLAVTRDQVLTEALVASLLGFDEVIVGRQSYSTDAGVFTDVWGDFIALLYRPDSAELVEGTTPHTILLQKEGYPVPREFPKEEVLFPVAVQDKYVVKNVSTSFGYLIIDPIA